MSPVKTLVRSSIFAGTMAIIFLASTSIFGQSTDPAHPTPITSFPVIGSLASGTYYYAVPKSLLSAGPANAGLDMTPPDGGGSMTVTFSGRGCCPPEAYIGITTGLADRMYQATTFNIPTFQESLLVTVYVSVGAGQTVGFRLTFANQGPSSSGVIVTPPPSTPTRPTPTEPVCTDLGTISFSVSPLTSMRNKISGVVVNVTTANPYKGYEHRQWVEVRDITDSETRPALVGRIWIPAIIDPGRSFPFAVAHNLTERRRTRYEVRIVYSPLNRTDESQYNDDCNTGNNSTRRQLIGAPLDEGELELETAPKRKP
jgi:hypothetical protein